MAIDINTLRSLGLTEKPQAAQKRNELGQDVFLKLMTTQLQNQNPLNPQDGAEFVSQLAQFSMVSGIQSLQDRFDSFSSSMTENQALQASQLVGKDVLVASSQGILGPSGGLAGELDLPADSSQVMLRVTGPGGRTMRTLELGEQAGGTVAFNWDGLLDDGVQRASPGIYTVKAEALIEGKTQALETNIQIPVESVTLGGSQGIEVDLGVLGRRGLKDIREIL